MWQSIDLQYVASIYLWCNKTKICYNIRTESMDNCCWNLGKKVTSYKMVWGRYTPSGISIESSDALTSHDHSQNSSQLYKDSPQIAVTTKHHWPQQHCIALVFQVSLYPSPLSCNMTSAVSLCWYKCVSILFAAELEEIILTRENEVGCCTDASVRCHGVSKYVALQ